MKKILAFLSVFVLTSCASQIMESYIGKDIKEVMMDYGAPSAVLDLDKGKKAYQWHKVTTEHVPAQVYTTSSAYGMLHTPVTNTYFTPAYSYSSDCFYTFIAEQRGDKWVVASFRSPALMCE